LRSIFMIFVAAFFTLTLSTTAAVRSVPAMYVRAARNFGLSDNQILQRVIFPAILPQIVLALRVTAGIAWIVIVAAEMVAVQDGLGWLITDARYQGARTDLIVGTMIVIGLLGWIIDVLLRRLERHPLVSWGYPRHG
jgi:NitT/TauT family transport system permease protein